MKERKKERKKEREDGPRRLGLTRISKNERMEDGARQNSVN
jgi:hypothetical protein